MSKVRQQTADGGCSPGRFLVHRVKVSVCLSRVCLSGLHEALRPRRPSALSLICLSGRSSRSHPPCDN